MLDDAHRILRALPKRNVPPVELVCREHHDPRRGASGWLVMRLSTCLADAGEDLVPVLLASGVRVATCTAGCARRDASREWLRTAQSLITAVGGVQIADHDGSGRAKRDIHDLQGPQVTRRQMFLLPTAEKDEPFAGHTPRERTLAALRHLTRDGIPPTLAALPAPAGILKATGCVDCGVCVRACEEGSLLLTHTENAFELVHEVQTCTDCGACVRLCPSNVMQRSQAATWGEVLAGTQHVLASGASRECTRCHSRFSPVADETRCPVCTFRAANPFGARFPEN